MKPEEIAAIPNTNDFWFIRYRFKDDEYTEPAQLMRCYDGFLVFGTASVIKSEDVIEVVGPAVLGKKPEPEPQLKYGVYRVKYRGVWRVGEFSEPSNNWALSGLGAAKNTSELEEIGDYLAGPSWTG